MRIARSAACLLTVLACAEPGNKDEHLTGPDATDATRAASAWAASVDADTARARPVRCNLPAAIAEGAVVYVQRPNDSATKIVADYVGPWGRATENYFAISDVVRVFVRVDETFENPAEGLRARRIVDSLWFAGGQVERWVDSLGRSRHLGRRSVGYRAFNIQRFYDGWRRAVQNCR